MGRKEYNEFIIPKDQISAFLNSPNIIYDTPDFFDNSLMHVKQTGKDRLRYRIEYLRV